MPQKPSDNQTNAPQTPMTPEAAARIQAAADKNPSNDSDFHKRAQAAAAKNENS
ncbi:hypothetical protein BGZ46_003968, partial [Entomortierella lignicola]